MGDQKLRALLVSESRTGRSHLSEHLRGKGCECILAASSDEARYHLQARTFHFVFSPMRLNALSLFPLMDLLEGSEVTLFYFYAVEEGAWCLPACPGIVGKLGLRRVEKPSTR